MRLESSQKIIVVSAILCNILRLWGEEDNEEGESDDNNVTVPYSLFEMKQETQSEYGPPGQVERDRMKDSMPLR